MSVTNPLADEGISEVESTVHFEAAKLLSPKRKSTLQTSIPGLAGEQLEHFGIDASSEYGSALLKACTRFYQAQSDVTRLWDITVDTIQSLDKCDRIAYFNAKKFLSFQVAKILDTLQNPFRKSYQGLNLSDASLQAKGPYPILTTSPLSSQQIL